MISIIIPVYNVEKTLRQCLDSVLGQSYKNFEVIIVDDGSPDGSPAICDEYAEKDSRIKVIHKENGGVSSARNVGLQYAKGDWVTFVDSDDWLEPNYCEVISKTDADLTFFGEIWHCQDGKIRIFSSGEYYVKGSVRSIYEKLFYLRKNADNHEYFGFTWNKVFRLSIIEQNRLRFEEKLSLREDEVFTQEYCRHINSLRVIEMALYNYRSTNLGLSFSKKTSSEYILLINKIMEESQNSPIKELADYELSRIPKLYFLAMKAENDAVKCIEYYHSLYSFCKANNIHFPTRSIKYILKHLNLTIALLKSWLPCL